MLSRAFVSIKAQLPGRNPADRPAVREPVNPDGRTTRSGNCLNSMRHPHIRALSDGEAKSRLGCSPWSSSICQNYVSTTSLVSSLRRVHCTICESRLRCREQSLLHRLDAHRQNAASEISIPRAAFSDCIASQPTCSVCTLCRISSLPA